MRSRSAGSYEPVPAPTFRTLSASPSAAQIRAAIRPSVRRPTAYVVQARDLACVREQPLAAPEYDRVHEEAVLVDQPGGDEIAYHHHAAGDHDILAWPRRQLLDLVLERASQHGGVLPFRLREAAGDDVLRHLVQVVGDAGLVVGNGQ